MAVPECYEFIDLLETRASVKDAEGARVVRMLFVGGAAVVAVVLSASLLTQFGTNVISPFLYFQF